jgi:hypothetical protein
MQPRLPYPPDRLWRAQIEEMTVDKENVQAQVQALRTDNSHIQQKQQQIEREISKEIPQNKVSSPCSRE